MSARMKFKWRQLGRDLKDKRAAGHCGVRGMARYIGISTATLSRAENGNPCTVPVFLRLCAWLGNDPFSYQRKDRP